MKLFIRRFPDPILREKSDEIKKIDKNLIDFIEKLKDLMYSNKGCVGIAAPQVGFLKKIVLVDTSKHKKAIENHGFLLMINPQIIECDGVTITREGCLSVPDFTGNVTRFENIKVKYFDISGEAKSIMTFGFEAVVIQHEIDHLDGVLFIDRIKNSKRDLFNRKNY
jgi:peptide deformylase